MKVYKVYLAELILQCSKRIYLLRIRIKGTVILNYKIYLINPNLFSFCHKLKFSNTYLFNLNGSEWYFKYRFFDPTEFIFWNMIRICYKRKLHLQVYSGLHHYHNLHHIYPPSHHHQSPRQTVYRPIIIRRGVGYFIFCIFCTF